MTYEWREALGITSPRDQGLHKPRCSQFLVQGIAFPHSFYLDFPLEVLRPVNRKERSSSHKPHGTCESKMFQVFLGAQQWEEKNKSRYTESTEHVVTIYKGFGKTTQSTKNHNNCRNRIG